MAKSKVVKKPDKQEVCKECKGTKILEVKGVVIECSCVKKAKIKSYIGKYGSMSMPSKWITDKLDAYNKTGGLEKNTIFMFDDTINVREQNGAMGYALTKVYPKPYTKLNIFELIYIAFEDGAYEGFNNIHQITSPLLILTYGQGEFKNKRQEELINQLIMKRLSDGSTTWFHSYVLNIQLREVRNCLSKCEYDEMRFDNRPDNLFAALKGIK